MASPSCRVEISCPPDTSALSRWLSSPSYAYSHAPGLLVGTEKQCEVDRKQIIGFCVFYLLLTGFFIIASRKHYTVDLVVGFFLSFLLSTFALFLTSSSFVFKDGWIPHGSLIESPYEVLQIESAV